MQQLIKQIVPELVLKQEQTINFLRIKSFGFIIKEECALVFCVCGTLNAVNPSTESMSWELNPFHDDNKLLLAGFFHNFLVVLFTFYIFVKAVRCRNGVISFTRILRIALSRTHSAHLPAQYRGSEDNTQEC